MYYAKYRMFQIIKYYSIDINIILLICKFSVQYPTQYHNQTNIQYTPLPTLPSPSDRYSENYLPTDFPSKNTKNSVSFANFRNSSSELRFHSVLPRKAGKTDNKQVCNMSGNIWIYRLFHIDKIGIFAKKC